MVILPNGDTGVLEDLDGSDYRHLVSSTIQEMFTVLMLLRYTDSGLANSFAPSVTNVGLGLT